MQYKRALGDDYYYDPRDCFEEGVKWADDNPKLSWIRVDDSLPEQDEEVIVLCDELNTALFYKISFGHIVDKTLHRFNLVGFMAERLGGNTATVETCAASM